MRDDITLTGIVLYTSLLNEYDKRLVILTKERGKITVFANGARRPNSNIRAASQSYVMGKFTVMPGKDAYSLYSAEVEEYFQGLQLDMEKMCYAAYFCEFMSYYTREGDYCKNNLNLLYFTLKALVEGTVSNELIRYVYEVRLMSIEGQGIHSFGCVKCSEDVKPEFFDAESGGLMCRECAKKYKIDYEVSPTLVYTLQYIMTTPVNKLYNFCLGDEYLKEFSSVVDMFRNKYVDKKFKSLEILASLT